MSEFHVTMSSKRVLSSANEMNLSLFIVLFCFFF